MTTHKENAAYEGATSQTANELKTGSHTSYTAELIGDVDLLRKVIAVLQRQLWESQHVEGGAEARVILAYHGTGAGAPKFLAWSAGFWAENPEPGWHVVLEIDAAGHIRQGGEK